jgi:hypothetical protein
MTTAVTLDITRVVSRECLLSVDVPALDSLLAAVTYLLARVPVLFKFCLDPLDHQLSSTNIISFHHLQPSNIQLPNNIQTDQQQPSTTFNMSDALRK